MRTTVDLAPAVHARALRMAGEQGRSLSSVVAELVARGLAQLDAPVQLTVNPDSGLPVYSIGGPIVTAESVAATIDENDA